MVVVRELGEIPREMSILPGVEATLRYVQFSRIQDIVGGVERRYFT